MKGFATIHVLSHWEAPLVKGDLFLHTGEETEVAALGEIPNGMISTGLETEISLHSIDAFFWSL